MEKSSNLLAENIARIRNEQGVTQAALAERIGVDLRTYQKYEAGTVWPSARVLSALSKALGISIAEMFGGQPESRNGGLPLEIAEAVRSAIALPPEEQEILALFRQASADGRATILDFVRDSVALELRPASRSRRAHK